MKDPSATIVLLLLAALPLLAQRSTGSVAGTVTDSTGSTVPGARIVVTNLATGIERTVSSNDAGFYSVTAIPAGRYSITVTKEGFSTYGIPEVTLQVDQSDSGTRAATSPVRFKSPKACRQHLERERSWSQSDRRSPSSSSVPAPARNPATEMSSLRRPRQESV